MSLWRSLCKLVYNTIKKLFSCQKKEEIEPDREPLLNYVPQIINAMVKQDFVMVGSVDIYYLYEYICLTETNDVIMSWNLTDKFILNLFDYLRNKYIGSNSIKINHLEQAKQITKKLITIYLFSDCNHIVDISNFLRNKKDLFDVKLWFELLLNSKYGNDREHLFITNYLSKFLFNIHTPIKYYDREHTIFEFILLGKITFDNNLQKPVHKRFFNTNAIIKFIHDNNSKVKYTNLKFIGLLERMAQTNKYDNNYLIMVIALLSK